MSKLGRFFQTPLLSPRGLLTRVLLIAVAFGVAHAAGLRQYTSILSGTAPTGEVAGIGPALAGCVYVTLYFSFVLVAPIFLIAAALLALAGRFLDGKAR